MRRLPTGSRSKLKGCLLTAWIGLAAACAYFLDDRDERSINCVYQISPPSTMVLQLEEAKHRTVSGEISFGHHNCQAFEVTLPWTVSNHNRFVKLATIAPESTSPAILTVQAMSPSEAAANLEQGPATWATRSGVETGSIYLSASFFYRVAGPFFFRGGLTRVDVVIDPEKAAEEARIEPAPDAVISLPSALQFDTQSRSSRPACIGNRGLSDLRVDAVSISSSDFRLSQDHRDALPLRVPKGRTTCLTVDFHPTNGGSRQAAIRITSNDPATPVATIRLEGTPNE